MTLWMSPWAGMAPNCISDSADVRFVFQSYINVPRIQRPQFLRSVTPFQLFDEHPVLRLRVKSDRPIIKSEAIGVESDLNTLARLSLASGA